MSLQSKFTERFDIDSTDPMLDALYGLPSPRNSSVYSRPEFNNSSSSWTPTTAKGSLPIAIPQNKDGSVTPPCSPPREGLSSKVKQFFSLKKKNASTMPTTAKA